MDDVYTTELFPTRVRSIGGGMLGVLGNIATSTIPLIMGVISRAAINPFIVFTMMGLIGIANFTFLRETSQTILPDEI